MAMHNRLIRTMLINIVTELNPPRSTGRPRVDVGMCVDDVLHMCRTSQPWATLRTTCGSFKTVYKWFRDWVGRGVFDLLWSRVQALYLRRRPSRHHIVDTSYVKNILGIDCIGKNPTDRGRSATKVSAVTDDIGVPIRLHLFPGNASDQKVLPKGALEFNSPTPVWVGRSLSTTIDLEFEVLKSSGISCLQFGRFSIHDRPRVRPFSLQKLANWP